MCDVKKKRRYRFKSYFSLFLVSMLMLIFYVPVFASGAVEVNYSNMNYSVVYQAPSDVIKEVSFPRSGTTFVKVSGNPVPTKVNSGVKFLEFKVSDKEDRFIDTVTFPTASDVFTTYDSSGSYVKMSFLDACNAGHVKIKKEDGSYVSVTSNVISVKSNYFHVELYGEVNKGQSVHDILLFKFDKFNVANAPIFTLNQSSVSVSKDKDVEITGKITDGYSNSTIEHRINNSSWSTSGVDHDGFGNFTITKSSSSFPYKENTVEVRVQSEIGIYSKILTVSVSNNFADVENPDPNPDPGGNPGGENPPGGGSGSLKINFNIGDMFTHSNSVLGSFMILLTVIVGISVGFRVVRFVKDLF